LYLGKPTNTAVEQLKETLTEKAKSSARGVRNATNLLFAGDGRAAEEVKNFWAARFCFRMNGGGSLRSPFVY
jgi:hypothetical protein